MNSKYIRSKLEGLERRNQERDEKRKKVRAEHLERKKMGTVREYERYVRKMA